MKLYKKYILVGDVHGCLDETKELLDKLSPTEDDFVLFLGDLVDKGPYPLEVVKFVKDSGLTSLRGNHEAKYIKYYKNELKKLEDPKYKNKMRLPEGKLSFYNALLEEGLIPWLRAQPKFFVREDWSVAAVHGGLVPGKTIQEQDSRELLYRRYVDEQDTFLSLDQALKRKTLIHWSDTYTGPYQHVFYGHSVLTMSRPHITEPKEGIWTYGIDQGCVHGGYLTAAVVTAEEIYFEMVKARKIYNSHDRAQTPEEHND